MSNQQEFLRKIADGKLLMRKHYDSLSVECDCCGTEKGAAPGEPDTLEHESWCVVTAARSFFPGFVPSPYPSEIENTRRRYNEHEPQFSWLEPVQEQEP